METEELRDATWYYECHVTIEPVLDERACELEKIATFHNFKVANLIMKKTGMVNEDDSFMTSRHKNYRTLHGRMMGLLNELKSRGFVIYRYKTEETIFDSKVSGDTYGFIRK